jgi:hypothetical protein
VLIFGAAAIPRSASARGRERVTRPGRQLVRVVAEAVGHPPIGHHPAPALAGRISERLELLALEGRRVVLVGFEIDEAVGDERQHQAVGENAGAAEQAAHLHRPEFAKQLADIVGSHGAGWPQRA